MAKALIELIADDKYLGLNGNAQKWFNGVMIFMGLLIVIVFSEWDIEFAPFVMSLAYLFNVGVWIEHDIHI